MNKKISVIIPIYNTEEFLEVCLNSVLKQTYHDLEILLINDGSSDACKQLIEAQAQQDQRIVSYHFTERKGVGAARNFGLQKATGDYVYFLDSDDYLAEETLQLLVEHIGNADMLSGNIKNVTKSDEPVEPYDEIERIIYKEVRSRPFINRSVLNRLISRDFITRHQLRFSEDVTCYSDLAFIVPAMIHLEEILLLTGCFYFRRLRNDPISNPSLMQLGREQRIADFLTIYNTLRDTYRTHVEATDYLDQRFLNFYERTCFLLFRSKNKISEWFDPLAHSAKQISPHILAQKRFIVRREITFLIRGKQDKFTRLVMWHHQLKTLRKAVKNKRNFYIQLYRSIFMRMPFKEKTIVFESYMGKNYACNPKYMYEYMLKQNMDFKYVWSFNEPGRNIPGNAKQVKRFSLAYYYYLATAKYWVSNSRMPLHLGKREGNIYVQTWHGTTLKTLVFDIKEVHSANPNYKKLVYRQSRRWDYMLSANEYSTEIFRRAFKYEKDMLEYGYPRNDLLYHENSAEMAESIKQKLNIPKDKKAILYAPTWRDNEFYERGSYKFKLKLNLQLMKQQLGNDYIILLRMHYFIADHIDTTGFDDFAYNVSEYDDIAELYLISDLLITDYSSVFFDYANLRRPMLFYTYDLEDYRDTLRGFYLDIEQTVPGPLLKTTDDVIDTIKRIDEVQDAYKAKYDAFYHRFCSWDNGEAAEHVVNHIFGD